MLKDESQAGTTADNSTPAEDAGNVRRHNTNVVLAAVLRPLNYMPCIKIGNRAISGRAVLNKKLWNNGAIVRVWKKYFIVYEVCQHSR